MVLIVCVQRRLLPPSLQSLHAPQVVLAPKGNEAALQEQAPARLQTGLCRDCGVGGNNLVLVGNDWGMSGFALRQHLVAEERVAHVHPDDGYFLSVLPSFG
jgi:hypothetical protein